MGDAKREEFAKRAREHLVLALRRDPGLEPQARREAMEDFTGEGLDEVLQCVPADRFGGDGAAAELSHVELSRFFEAANVASAASLKRHLSGRMLPGALRFVEPSLRQLAKTGKLAGVSGDALGQVRACLREVCDAWICVLSGDRVLILNVAKLRSVLDPPPGESAAGAQAEAGVPARPARSSGPDSRTSSPGQDHWGKPAEEKPTGETPAEQKLAEQKPAGEKPAELTPPGETPAEQKPAGKKPGTTGKPALKRELPAKPAKAARRVKVAAWLLAVAGSAGALLVVLASRRPRVPPAPERRAAPAPAPAAAEAPVKALVLEREPVPARPAAQPPKKPAGRVKTEIEWVRIPGGPFIMGSDFGSPEAGPAHRVVMKSFEMARTEVTNAQYRQCVKAGACSPAGSDADCRAASSAPDQPVVCVSWEQARAFAAWVKGRLPTEAEWEYAARSAGDDSDYPWGSGDISCWYAVVHDGRSGCGRNAAWPVCSKTRGNTKQGLCDMAGNVWEWTQDWYHDSYVGAPSDGSAWESPAGSARVRRGGSWSNYGSHAKTSLRRGLFSGSRVFNLGLRPAR